MATFKDIKKTITDREYQAGIDQMAELTESFDSILSNRNS